MAPRKRKQPEKKKKPAPRRPSLAIAGLGLAGRGLMAASRVAARNPGVVCGSAAFIVVFSFVAANALWYQPGAHPSPYLRTRLPFSFPDPASLGASGTGLDPKTVTTFVIKREDEIAAEAAETTGTTQTAAVERPVARQPLPSSRQVDQKNGDDVAALIESAEPVVGPSPKTVAAIQKELAQRGLYDGDADGKLGPRTRAAIEAFEKNSGRVVTGEANDALLARLRATARPAVAATPDTRPYQNVKAEKGELDAVAAAIRQASVDPQYIPKADIPASSELVMHIQQGLVNLAYADVTVDGVASDQTRAAIRHFEKHYRLPPTGEPSDAVLRKMKSIGAL